MFEMQNPNNSIPIAIPTPKRCRMNTLALAEGAVDIGSNSRPAIRRSQSGTWRSYQHPKRPRGARNGPFPVSFSGLLSLFYLPIGFRPRRHQPAIGETLSGATMALGIPGKLFGKSKGTNPDQRGTAHRFWRRAFCLLLFRLFRL